MNLMKKILFFLQMVSLGLNTDSNNYKLHKNNGSSNFKFSSRFESSHLLDSYSNTLSKFSPAECIFRLSQKNLVVAISYEINDNSTIYCKSYSSLTFLSTDILETQTKSIIYLRINKCEYFIFLLVKIFVRNTIVFSFYFTKMIW